MATRSCVGTVDSESFLVTPLCLPDVKDELGALIPRSVVSNDCFLGCEEGIGDGDGDSSRMVGGALRPFVGGPDKLPDCFVFLTVILLLTDCL